MAQAGGVAVVRDRFGMLTEAQKTQFVEALDYYCTESKVVATRDTVSDFIARWGEPTDRQESEHGDVLVWNRIQTRKGAARGDLYVMDFGDARAAYFSGEA